MSDGAAGPPADPAALIRSPEYRRLLALAAVIGFVVSLAAWCWLTLIPLIQDGMFQDLPQTLGFDTTPAWWPLPVLAVAGLITAYAVNRMPGGGGGVPAEGFASGPINPAHLPSILLAATATLGLGLVLGPSSPVIAIGAGVAVFILRRVVPNAPKQVELVVGAAGSFAAFAMIFQSPVIAAVILVEAAGLGGPMLSAILLPGLLAAGIGSLVYLGMGQLTGLSTSAYALNPLSLPAIGDLTLEQFGWAVLVAVIAAVVGHLVVRTGLAAERLVRARPFVLVPAAGVLVAACAIAFAQSTGQSDLAVLFSGSRALSPIVADAGTLTVGTLAALVLFKGFAWGISMGSFRGGPVFPAIFLGTVGGLLASHLPGFPEGAAVAVAMGATVAAILRLPLASVVIAFVLTTHAGPAATPLIIVAVVVSHLVTGRLTKAATADGPAVGATP